MNACRLHSLGRQCIQAVELNHARSTESLEVKFGLSVQTEVHGQLSLPAPEDTHRCDQQV